eukprot:2300947-Rhodomonas_salina.1
MELVDLEAKPQLIRGLKFLTHARSHAAPATSRSTQAQQAAESYARASWLLSSEGRSEEEARAPPPPLHSSRPPILLHLLARSLDAPRDHPHQLPQVQRFLWCVLHPLRVVSKWFELRGLPPGCYPQELELMAEPHSQQRTIQPLPKLCPARSGWPSLDPPPRIPLAAVRPGLAWVSGHEEWKLISLPLPHPLSVIFHLPALLQVPLSSSFSRSTATTPSQALEHFTQADEERIRGCAMRKYEKKAECVAERVPEGQLRERQQRTVGRSETEASTNSRICSATSRMSMCSPSRSCARSNRLRAIACFL